MATDRPDSFVSRFTDAVIEDTLEIGHSFYKVDADQRVAIEKIRAESGMEPRHAGTFLGDVKDKKFKPSIALLDLIAAKTERKIVIDKKAEWLFLCGRDIFGKSVLKAGVRKGQVIVMNQKKEVLGYGKIVSDLSNTEKVAVKNLLDRGDFLRRER